MCYLHLCASWPSGKPKKTNNFIPFPCKHTLSVQSKWKKRRKKRKTSSLLPRVAITLLIFWWADIALMKKKHENTVCKLRAIFKLTWGFPEVFSCTHIAHAKTGTHEMLVGVDRRWRKTEWEGFIYRTVRLLASYVQDYLEGREGACYQAGLARS